MKTFFYKIGIFVFSAFILTSCNDDFLERYPLDKLSNESFWKTENDLAVYNNSIYDATRTHDKGAVLQGHSDLWASGHVGYQYLDGMTDNQAPTHNRMDSYKTIRAGQHIASSPQNYGYKGWDILRAINVGLDHYQNAPLDQKVIDKYAAEARLFRAWWYYDKVSKFGDMQWVDHEVATNEDEILFGKRDDREFVMGKVLEDINFAVLNLPKTRGWGLGQDPGRLDHWDALALKSRLCLFEGTWRKYHGGSDADMWIQEAADASKDLIDNGGYSLYNTGDPLHDYNATHRSQDLTGNPEIIHWIKYETGIRNNNIIKWYIEHSGGATKSMVEDYLCKDGLPISLSSEYAGDAQIEDVFINRDPRLRQTVMHPEDKDYYEYNQKDTQTYPRLLGQSGTKGGNIRNSSTGYHIIKTYVQEVHAGPHNYGQTPGIVFRLAEVYLNYAEAKAELGTISQGDLDITINKLRDRVGMTHLSLNPAMDPRYASDGISSLLVEIRRERRIELYSEGRRYDDLRRWKQGKKLEIKDYGMLWDDVAKARYPGATVKSSLVDGKPYIEVYQGQSWENPVFVEPKHYLWPIPITIIGQNPELGQNPGWE